MEGSVLVKGGILRMGRRNVTVEDFYMESSDVTQLEYESYSRNADNPSQKKGDDLPVESVTWNEAVDYCNLRSRKDNLEPCYTENNGKYEYNFNANGYRLPTEAEWEYAFDKVGAEYRGSVLEWCWDSEGENRVVRGTTPGGTVFVRNAFPPDFRSCEIGFRVVRSRMVKSNEDVSLETENSEINNSDSVAQTKDDIDYLRLGKEAYYKKDYIIAFQYYEKASEQGDSDAQNYLGWMYLNGYGVTKDYEKAVEWFRKSAEQGNADGQNNLGFMYYKGYVVTKDYEKAVEWFRKSADQGNAFGQSNLGWMYRNGYGVEQDYGKAVELYRKSANQGNADGQNNLGFMYYKGFGVTKDYEKAMDWYKKAADQGNESAKKALERLRKK